MRRIRNITGLMLFITCLAIMSRAQSVATITAVIKDTTGANVGSGKVTFDQIPNIATTDGTSIFTPLTVTCKIIAGGVLKANDGVSACQLVYNPTNSPAGTFYKTTYYPLNAKTAVMNLFVSAASQDISTVLQTPATMPAYNIVDLVSTQTISGIKTFSGVPVFTAGISGTAGQTLALPSAAGTLASNNNTVTFTGKSFSGSVGFGTATPLSPLTVHAVSGPDAGSAPTGAALIENIGSTTLGLSLGIDPTGTANGWIQARDIGNTTKYNLLLNPLGGFVGVGTETPSAAFHTVRGTGTGGYGTVAKFSSNLLDENVEIIVRSTAVSSIGTSSAHAFSLYANNLEGLRVDAGVADVHVLHGILPDGSGFKHKRIASCTTAASLGAACGSTVTWGTAFPDANYTATCAIEQGSNLLYVNNLSSRGAGSVTVVLENAPGSAAAASGTIDCIAIHD